jgi:hypothetical protein
MPSWLSYGICDAGRVYRFDPSTISVPHGNVVLYLVNAATYRTK